MTRPIHALCFTAICLLLYGCGTMKSTNGVPNLDTVDSTNNIWRGGQPTKAGWDWLKSKGVTNVVKLNEAEASDEGQGESDDYAKSIGMRVYEFPIDTDDQLFGGGGTHIERAVLKLHELGANTVVHCRRGSDRTGTVVALYHNRYDGWPKQTCIDDMLEHGFNKSLLGLWGYVNKHLK